MTHTQSVNDIMQLIDKKLTSDTRSPKQLVQAEGNSCFWIHNGPVLKNLVDLRDAFETINDEQFNYHVNKDKNDFANWIRDVLHEIPLATKLQNYRTKKTMIKTINVFLKKYYGIK